MRVNSIPPKEIYSRYLCAREVQPVTTSRAMGTDHVELSSTAKSFSATLKSAREALSVQDPARAARISVIKQKIESNTYFVPAEQVAEKIFEV